MSDTASSRPDAATITAMVEGARGLAVASADDPGLPFESANVELLAAVKVLDAAAFERVRVLLRNAKVRVPELDKLIAARLGQGGNSDRLPGRRIEWPEDEPWPDPVDGAALLSEITATLKRFVVMPAHAAETCALWSVAAHALDNFDIFPRLGITSPTPECGKTTLLGMIGRLVPRKLIASNATGPAIFRAIEMAQPTLLIDEADTFLPKNDELRGILNSGHKRETAFVLRVVGEEHDPRQFTTWTPMVLAAIGELPATLSSRSLRVRMERRLAGEAIERLRKRDDPTFERLRRQIARWSADKTSDLAAWDGDASTLMNRAADNWMPLVAVAEKAGGAWPALVEAAITVEKGQPAEPTAIGIQLLADLLSIFEAEDKDELPTKQLLTALAGMEERPWKHWGKPPKDITDIALGKLLKPFGIRSRDIWLGEPINRSAKGYQREPIREAWARYGISGFEPARPKEINETNRLVGNPIREVTNSSRVGNGSNQLRNKGSFGLAGLTAQNPTGGHTPPPISALDAWLTERSADDDLLAAEREEARNGERRPASSEDAIQREVADGNHTQKSADR